MPFLADGTYEYAPDDGVNTMPVFDHDTQEYVETPTEPQGQMPLTLEEKVEFIYAIAVRLSALYDDLKPEDVAKAKAVMNGPLGSMLKNAFKH